MPDRIPRELLVCPDCRQPLSDGSGGLGCAACGRDFPVVDGVPILLPAGGGAPCGPDPSRIGVSDRGWVGRAKQLVGLPSPTFETAKQRARIPRFLASFPPEARILNVGSAGLRYGDRVLNLDLLPGDGVDLVGDATRMPFRDGCLDGIVSRRVLEHVRGPGAAVREMERVLASGGRVWVEIPFMQGYHPTPTDYQRYTRAGIEDLFAGFSVEEVGVALGPSSTLSWVLREYLAILFSFDRPLLYKIGERVFGWATLPVKYLDLLTARSRFAGQIASSFYLVARKP